MRRVETKADVREAVVRAREDGRTIGLVPTMGYLHEGHLSLVDRARERADTVVMSVFVNPLQFGPGEDFEAYPRDPDRDARLADDRGVDLVFAPSGRELYPRGEAQVRVVPGAMADRLCGAFRPGHFEGVLTIVTKLFNIVRPDLAVFGRKDYQQGVLIRRMAADLDLPVEIDLAPIVREDDGLALSSRNSYLSDDERRQATSLYRGLRRAVEAFRAGERDADALREVVRDTLDAEPVMRPEYIEVAEPDTLEPLERAVEGGVVAAAAYAGDTRLIDNVVLE